MLRKSYCVSSNKSHTHLSIKLVWLSLFWELVMYQYLSANKVEYIDCNKKIL